MSLQLQETAQCRIVLVDTVQEKMSIAAGAEMNYVGTLETLCIALAPLKAETSFEYHCSIMDTVVLEILSQT